MPPMRSEKKLQVPLQFSRWYLRCPTRQQLLQHLPTSSCACNLASSFPSLSFFLCSLSFFPLCFWWKFKRDGYFHHCVLVQNAHIRRKVTRRRPRCWCCCKNETVRERKGDLAWPPDSRSPIPMVRPRALLPIYGGEACCRTAPTDEHSSTHANLAAVGPP